MGEFSSKGFAGARVAGIAQRAGVDKQLISYYFSGKEGLHRALLRHQFSQEGLVNDPDLPLAEVAARYVRHALADPRMTRLLLWDGLSGPSTDTSGGPGPNVLDLAGMRRRQERGELAADIDVAAMLLVVIGAVTAAVALPQVVEAVFGADTDAAEFEDRYAQGLGRIVDHLRAHDGPGTGHA